MIAANPIVVTPDDSEPRGTSEKCGLANSQSIELIITHLGSHYLYSVTLLVLYSWWVRGGGEIPK